MMVVCLIAYCRLFSTPGMGDRIYEKLKQARTRIVIKTGVSMGHSWGRVKHAVRRWRQPSVWPIPTSRVGAKTGAVDPFPASAFGISPYLLLHMYYVIALVRTSLRRGRAYRYTGLVSV